MNLIFVVPDLLTYLLHSPIYSQENFILHSLLLVSYLSSLKKVTEEESKLAKPNCKNLRK